MLRRRIGGACSILRQVCQDKARHDAPAVCPFVGVYVDGMTSARPLAARMTGWHATRNVEMR